MKQMFFLKFPFFMIKRMLTVISDSSAFSQSSLYIWKFSVHVRLKPSLKNFEHYLTSMWNKHNCIKVGTFFLALLFFGFGMKTDLFQYCGNCWIFQICWHTECSTLTASSFQIWNSSAGILSPPLALFVVMLLKNHLISHARMTGFRWVITMLWLSGSFRPLLYSFPGYSCLENFTDRGIWWV